MDSLKKPETILSLSTAVGLGAASFYFQKKLGSIQEQLDKLAEVQLTTIDKADQVDNTRAQVQHIGQHINDVRNKLQTFSQEVIELQTAFDQQETYIQAIIKALADNDIHVNAPGVVRRNNRRAPANGYPMNNNPMNNNQGGYQPPTSNPPHYPTSGYPTNNYPSNGYPSNDYQQPPTSNPPNMHSSGGYQPNIQQPMGGYSGGYQPNTQQPMGGYPSNSYSNNDMLAL